MKVTRKEEGTGVYPLEDEPNPGRPQLRRLHLHGEGEDEDEP